MDTRQLHCLALSTFLLVPLSAYPQTTLTGAMWMATTSSGTTSVAQAYADGALNTLGSDQWWDLWLALNPDATLPINGPSDTQASISIPLEAGKSYKYYIFGQGPCCNLAFSGLNLFFDGNGSNPAISVFGAVNTAGFRPDSSSTLTLQGTPVRGSGTAFYSKAGVTVVLTSYNWNASGTPPGDVCQEFAFSPAPGDVLSAFGSFSLQVFSAATLSLSQASASPGTELTFTGTGFAAYETVEIYAGQLSTSPIHATMTDASGDFTLTLRVPQLPYGVVDFYVEGLTSGELGAATLSVTPAVGLNPGTVAPEVTTTAYVFGFGSSETVDIYWNNPRQLLGAATTKGDGSGTLTITIPGNVSPGLYGVIGVGQTTKAIGIGEVRVQ
jgi:hypothetical protein